MFSLWIGIVLTIEERGPPGSEDVLWTEDHDQWTSLSTILKPGLYHKQSIFRFWVSFVLAFASQFWWHLVNGQVRLLRDHPWKSESLGLGQSLKVFSPAHSRDCLCLLAYRLSPTRNRTWLLTDSVERCQRMCKPSGPKQKTTPASKSPTCACGPHPTPSMTAKANAHDEQKCDNLCLVLATCLPHINWSRLTSNCKSLRQRARPVNSRHQDNQ